LLRFLLLVKGLQLENTEMATDEPVMDQVKHIMSKYF